MENWWELEAKKAEELRKRKKEFPFEGKRVRRKGRNKWEEGIVVVDKFRIYQICRRRFRTINRLTISSLE